MEGKRKYTISLKDVHLYAHGTYQISCHISSGKSPIQFFALEEDSHKVHPTKSFRTKPLFIGENITELPKTHFAVHIDADNYPDPVYLHIDVLKLKSISEEEPSSSLQQNDYEKCSYGNASLQQHGGMFGVDSNRSEESTFNGVLKLSKVLEDTPVRVTAGWISYGLSVSSIEDVVQDDGQPVSYVSPKKGHQSVDLHSTPYLQSPEVDLPVVHSRQEVLFSGPKEATLSPEKHTNSVVPICKDDKVKSPEQQPLISPRQPDHKEEPPKSPLNIRTPEAPLSCSNVLVDLPNINAIKQILPKYHALECKPHQQQESDVQPHVPIREPETRLSLRVREEKTKRSYNFTPTPDHLTLSPHTKESLDVHVVAVLDYQSKELDRYRGVIQRMGADILQLRNEISALRDSKDELTMKLYYAGEGVVGDGDADAEVVQLKRGLAAERESKNELQKRVHTLQNQLIKKNDTEASFVELEAAHKTQQNVLLDLQKKMTKYKLLEETVKKQELVIERMEDRLKGEKSPDSINVAPSKSKPHSPNSPTRETHERGTKKKGRGVSKDKNVSFQPSAPSHTQNMQWNANMIEEKVHLLQRVEQAERTVAALEEQLYNNSRQWAKERSAMQRSVVGVNSQNVGFPQKMLTSRPHDQNLNYVTEPYQMRSRFASTLQFPPYTYQNPSNSSWKMP